MFSYWHYLCVLLREGKREINASIDYCALCPSSKASMDPAERPSCENFKLIAKTKIILPNMARAVIIPAFEIRERIFASNYITSAAGRKVNVW